MLIHVAVPVPGLGALTYQVPDGVGAPPIGARVVVPLGSRTVTGVVVEAVHRSETPAEGIKSVLRVLDNEAFLPGEIVSLAQWTAEYYLSGPGEALRMVLPPKSRGGRADSHKVRKVVSITPAGRLAIGPQSGEESHQLVTPKQRDVLGRLAERASGTIALSQLAQHGATHGVVATLARNGLVEVQNERVSRDPFAVSQLERNDELGIDRRVSVGGGMSRWLRDTNNSRIAFGGGLIRSWEDANGVAETKQDTEALVSMDFEWFHYDAPELDVLTKFTLYNRLSGSREPRGNLDVNFKWEVFKDFYWSFSVYYTFDQQHETGAATTDYGSFVSFGWKL